MPQLIALLRSINVGGRRITMADLQAAFESMGFTNVRTLLASGNVLFEGREDATLIPKIEAGLKAAFGFETKVLIRSQTTLLKMVAAAPFKAFPDGSDVKYYVYFLEPNADTKLDFPMIIEGDYEIVAQEGDAIFAVAHKMANGRYGAGLDKLAKKLGPHHTNRNWNTVLKLVEKANS